MATNSPDAASPHGSTAVPPGNCVTHGYHGCVTCPRCSTSAIPPQRLAPSPPAATMLAMSRSRKLVNLGFVLLNVFVGAGLSLAIGWWAVLTALAFGAGAYWWTNP